MPIFQIEAPDVRIGDSWDLGESVLESSKKVTDWDEAEAGLRAGAKACAGIPAADLLDFFDAAALRLASPESGSLEEYSSLGISWLIPFLRRANLERLLRFSLRGDLSCLESFVLQDGLGKVATARPRGLIVHWLAGNVPTLAAISLVQGLLTKNANAVKLPRQNGLFLPSFFAKIASLEHRTATGRVISGKDLAAATGFYFCTKDDLESARRLSISADVRFAWGGREAMESILRLPKKHDAEDVLFGPKTSIAAIGRLALNPEETEAVALRLALDASVFEQRGCNSPRTVFVESGGKVSPLEFAGILAAAMDKALKRIPKPPVSASEAYSVVALRNEYSLRGEVFASPGTEWTVVYDEEKSPAPACGGRVVFVRPVGDIFEVAGFIGPGTQTLGLQIDDERRIPFAEKAAAAGISRMTQIGKMSLFDYPWDGLFPMDRFVRWVSLE